MGQAFPMCGPFIIAFTLLEQRDGGLHGLIGGGKATITDTLMDKGFLVRCQMDFHIQIMGS